MGFLYCVLFSDLPLVANIGHINTRMIRIYVKDTQGNGVDAKIFVTICYLAEVDEIDTFNP